MKRQHECNKLLSVVNLERSTTRMPGHDMFVSFAFYCFEHKEELDIEWTHRWFFRLLLLALALDFRQVEVLQEN
jgi:hypothetical protein